jgi:transcriptional regulator with XRE-family HTH domain
VNDFGAGIAQLRRKARLSQTALAAKMCAVANKATFTRNEISRYERGIRTPGEDALHWFAASLGCPIDQLRELMTPTDPVDKVQALLNGDRMDDVDVSRLVYEWQATEPPHLTETRSGRLVGDRLASEIEARTVELRRFDDVMQGATLRPIVDRELSLALGVVRDASYTEPTGRRLLAAVADLAQLAGWVASDLGDHAAAKRHYLAGVQAGLSAGRPELVASALSSLAYQEANIGNPTEAVLMAGSALRGAPNADPTARTLFTERLAWTYARVGHADAALRTLDAADDLFNPTPDAPPWAYWLNRNEIDIMRGRVCVKLHNPQPAIDILTKAIKRYPANHIRETVLYRTYLIEAFIQLGDRTTARRELDQLDTATDSTRTDTRLHRLDNLLAHVR